MKMSTKSLKFRLIIFESLLLVLMLISAVSTFTRTRENIYVQNTNYVDELLSKMSQSIKSRFDIIENIMLSTAVNNAVESFLLSETKWSQVENSIKIDKYLVPIMNIDNKIYQVAVLSDNGNQYGLGVVKDRNENIMSLVKEMEGGRKSQFLGVISIDNIPMLVLATKVFNQRITNRYSDEIGTIVVFVSEKLFAEELAVDERFSSQYVIIDQDNKVIWSDGTYEIGDKLDLFDQNTIINSVDIPDIKMKIVSINSKQQLFKDVNKTLPFYLMIIGIMLLIPIATYAFFTVSVLKPLNEISKFISILTSGNLRYFNKRISIKASLEVELIANEINSLLDEVNNLTHRLVTTTSNLFGAEADKSKAELEFLKSQINPHFLYNTLGMIKGIALIRKEKEIAEIAASLAKIFNYSIKGSDIVTLQEEINITKAYILIQQNRFQDRFDVEYHLSEELLKVKMMKLLFQPIIENAVFHGIEPTSRKCILTIGGEIRGDNQIVLWVKDNGVGMSQEKVEALQRMLDDRGIWSKDHVGIVNINARIRHIYGDQYGVSIKSVAGLGTEVTLNLSFLE